MADNFANYQVQGGMLFNKGAAITPHDSTDFTDVCRAIWVGTTGNAVIVWPDNTTSQFNSIPSGTLLQVRARRVNSTNTTASNMVALY